MFTSSIINQDALQSQINSEVERLTAIKFEEFKNNLLEELSKNYYFDDCLLDKIKVARKLGISVRQVDNLVTKGKLKKCGLGRSVKFKNSDINEYVRSLS